MRELPLRSRHISCMTTMFPPQSPTRMSVTPFFRQAARTHRDARSRWAKNWTHRIVAAFPFHDPPVQAEKSGKGLLRRSSAINRRCKHLGIAQNADVEGHLLELPLHHGRIDLD